jgi:hypothetical protein
MAPQSVLRRRRTGDHRGHRESELADDVDRGEQPGALLSRGKWCEGSERTGETAPKAQAGETRPLQIEQIPTMLF